MATTKDGFHYDAGAREIVSGVYLHMGTRQIFATTRAALRALPPLAWVVAQMFLVPMAWAAQIHAVNATRQ
jgi:hypothetical protein